MRLDARIEGPIDAMASTIVMRFWSRVARGARGLGIVALVIAGGWGFAQQCPTTDITELYPEDPANRHPVILEALDKAWQATLDSGVEQGGVIVQRRSVNSDGTTTYEMDYIPAKPGGKDHIDFEIPPEGESLRVIATYHTHTEELLLRPSDNDQFTSARLKIPGFIKQGSKVAMYGRRFDDGPIGADQEPVHYTDEDGNIVDTRYVTRDLSWGRDSYSNWDCDCATGQLIASDTKAEVGPQQICISLEGTWVGTMEDPIGVQNITYEVLAHVGNEVSVSILYENGNVHHALPGIVEGDRVIVEKYVNGVATHIWDGVVFGDTISGTYYYTPTQHAGPFSVTEVLE